MAVQVAALKPDMRSGPPVMPMSPPTLQLQQHGFVSASGHKQVRPPPAHPQLQHPPAVTIPPTPAAETPPVAAVSTAAIAAGAAAAIPAAGRNVGERSRLFCSQHDQQLNYSFHLLQSGKHADFCLQLVVC